MQALYPAARDKFLTAQINWAPAGDTFRIYAGDSTCVYDPAHEFVDDLTGVLGNATLANLTNPGNGAADADDPSISGITAGLVVRSLVIAKWTGVDATSSLVYYASTQTDGTEINRTSDGVNPITFILSGSSARIFRI